MLELQPDEEAQSAQILIKTWQKAEGGAQVLHPHLASALGQAFMNVFYPNINTVIFLYIVYILNL